MKAKSRSSPLNSPFRADLHCHSTFSDGTCTPRELLEQAKACGLQGLSITDHDTIRAYPEVLQLATQYGIAMIPGVEFSTMHRGASVHVLAYGFDPEDSILRSFCEQHTQRRLDRNREILQLLSEHGMPLEEEEIASDTHTVGRPHIAQAMVEKGYVKDYAEAFQKYLGDQKPCYSRGHSFSTEETIDLIHSADAVAILAHPILLKNPSLLKELLTLPFDGIEGFYARFNRDDCAPFIQMGKERDWIISGGSDYHGTIKPQAYLGSSYVDRATFQALQGRRR